ncbi:hypothetical protein GPA07_13780 [Bacillus sp. ms-22]|uniref:hypothetical protein n=1 Tax=Bacillus sp. ms-22 TaxID=2683680 RepID=UPI0012F7AC21|nr:hypothetical protein [Bacillus sp. ms-22]QGX66468.1 hypothetical protein GPA07_13780 [Bacillus sp. ms-22]
MGIIDINFYFQSDNVQAVKSFLLNPSLWGSLAGASLSSIVAIGIMRKNLSRDRTLKLKEKLEEFLVEAVYFRDCVKLLIDQMDAFARTQRYEDYISEEEAELYKKMDEKEIIRCFKQINSVDRTKFSYEYYQHYFEIKRICEFELEFLWNQSMEHNAKGVPNLIFEDIEALKIELDKLNEIISAKEIELEKFK